MTKTVQDRFLSISLRVVFMVGLVVSLAFTTLAATPAYPQSIAEDTTDTLIFLPFVMKRFPFVPDAPVLDPISNEDGDGYYTVSWSWSEGADSYILQEAKSVDFSDAITVYSGGGTSTSISGRAVGTYYYRVQAVADSINSEWSNIQQVSVLPPMCEVYVENNTGGQLCYTVDDTGIGKKCFPGGTHYYGTFPAGIYTWHASASCGTDSGTENYLPGDFTHEFWCQ
jgi:hypothetical protein